LFDHPQVRAEDLVTTLDHPQVGPYRAMQGPVKFVGTPGPAPTPAPTFGQHSDEILTGCGYSADEITALRQRGVVL
jgi:crotonobetainyl-CoA:carnitine CoA-transferase CaiB-like acyl-CoA transferase